jgi:hypothetical protein
MKQLEITEEMINELRAKVLERVKDEFKKQYNSFAILQRIEEKQGRLATQNPQLSRYESSIFNAI